LTMMAVSRVFNGRWDDRSLQVVQALP